MAYSVFYLGTQSYGNSQNDSVCNLMLTVDAKRFHLLLYLEQHLEASHIDSLRLYYHLMVT